MEKKISEINGNDTRVRILGTVVAKDGNTIVLDDGTGRISATFETEPQVNIKQYVRVFGRVLQVDENIEIQGEIVQDMTQLDKELFKRIKEVEEKIGNKGA